MFFPLCCSKEFFMKDKLITAALALLAWAAALLLCFGLLCAASAVPHSSITKNLILSSDELNELMPHQMTVNGLYNSTADNYADAVLLGVASNMRSGSPVRNALDTKYYDDGYGPAVGIRASLGNYPPNVDYTRYWHGSLVLVRPLLALTDINGIRTVFAVLTALLFAADAVLLFVKKHTAAGVIFITAAALTHFPFVLTTIEYMHIYIIMLAALPLFMRFSGSSSALVILCAAVGTVTAFVDFLTAETLTLLVPLTAALFLRAEKGEKPAEKKNVLLVLACTASWGIAYALTFVMKWAAAAAVTGRSITETALAAAGERAFDMPDGITSRPVMILSALGANLTMLTPSDRKINVPAVIVWLLIFAAVCLFIAVRNKRTRTAPAALLIIAALPLLRFCVLMNHSYLHNYFTYRAVMASVMALTGFFWYRMAGAPSGKKTKKPRPKKQGVSQ